MQLGQHDSPSAIPWGDVRCLDADAHGLILPEPFVGQPSQ